MPGGDDLDPGQQDRQVDRLGHVVRRAELERANHVVHLIAGGHHDDIETREFRPRAQRFKRGEAVEPRHGHVEQNQIEPVGRLQCRERRGPDSTQVTANPARSSRRESMSRLASSSSTRRICSDAEAPPLAWGAASREGAGSGTAGEVVTVSLLQTARIGSSLAGRSLRAEQMVLERGATTLSSG